MPRPQLPTARVARPRSVTPSPGIVLGSLAVSILITAGLVSGPAAVAGQQSAGPQSAGPQSAIGRGGPVSGSPWSGSLAAAGATYVDDRPGPGRFPLAERGKAAPVVVDGDDFPGVLRVIGDLRSDIERVTGIRPTAATGALPAGASDVVLVGTLGRSTLIDDLVSRGRLDVRGVRGKWETSLEQVVDRPFPGVRRAFVLAGSDQRGTIYAAYDLSKQIGVSPWTWWDDVPPAHRDALYALPGRHTQGTPAVKYRGFFVNDENPSTGTWAPRYFGPGKAPGYPGGLNKDYWAKVFEVGLRLRANYVWPAVWGRAFAEDDPENHATATKYGIVMGTSHEAPMLRGIEEWNRHAKPAVRDSAGTITTPGSDPYGGTGEWSFRRNRDAITAYWRDGIRRMVEQNIEGVVTLGMRGNGDVSLPDGDAIPLMQDIIATERKVLAEETGKTDLSTIPQVWTLYKEVQRYWDQGLRAPDDVTVVFADDNWGNLRKLPDQSLPKRAGGYGMYYHFDYVGDGRNYKWADTNLLPNVWEQLDQAYDYGVDRLWMVNVGDLKNDELPLQFFLDYAWNPDALPQSKLDDWERAYAAQNFGPRYAAQIAEILREYSRLQSDRKPELTNRRITIDPAKDLATDSTAVVYDDQASPFSLTNYAELDRVTRRWKALAAQAEQLRERLPAGLDDAYFELVYYQVVASANLYELRRAQFTNRLYARQGRAATNDLAQQAQRFFETDQALNDYYNGELAGGKWKDWQLQPKIGYGDVERYGPNAPWQQPELNNVALPDAFYPHLQTIEVPDDASLGVAIDGSDQWWPGNPTLAPTPPPVLPAFSPYQTAPAQYIEVFNRGRGPLDYRVTSGQPWLRVTPAQGRVGAQTRLAVRIDWRKVPLGSTSVPITVTGSDGTRVVVSAPIERPKLAPSQAKGFVEAGGYVSWNADRYRRSVPAGGVRWKVIEGLGRTGNAVKPFPSVATSKPAGSGPRLDYDVTLTHGGDVTLWTYLSPRNNVLWSDGLKYAVSVDGGEPQVVNITQRSGANDGTLNRQWAYNTSDNVTRMATNFHVDRPGRHTVTLWMVDPTVVVQKFVLDTRPGASLSIGGLHWSYFGPPTSAWLP
jgi:hypothetical protein